MINKYEFAQGYCCCDVAMLLRKLADKIQVTIKKATRTTRAMQTMKRKTKKIRRMTVMKIMKIMKIIKVVRIKKIKKVMKTGTIQKSTQIVMLHQNYQTVFQT